MTENEVNELSKRLGIDDYIDAAIEMQWIDENLTEATRSEARVIASFRMWRFLRNDANMQQAEKELKTIRDGLEYLRNRREEIVERKS